MFSKKNISGIPIEGTPHTSGSRKLLVGKEETTSSYFEAMTYGYLPAGEKWVMHKHENIVEICVVVKGSGTIRNSDGEVEIFTQGDRFIFPSNTEHELENTSSVTSEFYFFRLRDK